MWQREFIITNTLDHKMIYSAVSLLFSLTVNSFDLTEISPACSSSPSISAALVIVLLLYLTSSLENEAKNDRMSESFPWFKKKNIVFGFLVWVQDPSLSHPLKLYSSWAVIQLHPWPWTYCCRLNGHAFSKITVNALLSTSQRPGKTISH